MATTEVVDWGQSISQWGGGVDPVYDTEYDTELSLSFSLVVNLCVSEVIHLRYLILFGSKKTNSRLESFSIRSLVLTLVRKRDHALESLVRTLQTRFQEVTLDVVMLRNSNIVWTMIHLLYENAD